MDFLFSNNCLLFDQISLPSWNNDFLIKSVISILILIIGWWLVSFTTKTANKAMYKANIDEGIISFATSITKVSLRIVVLLAVASKMDLDITPIVTALGAATVVIGFALKDSFSNFASGALIIINKPFSVGDIIEITELKGTVTKIEIMFTTLLTQENKTILMPNSKITSSNIINCSSQDKINLDLSYSVSYNCDISKTKSILKDIIESNDKILKDPMPIIGVGELNESSISIMVKIWCEGNDSSDIYFYMQETVKSEFDKEGISIPFNQLDVHIKN